MKAFKAYDFGPRAMTSLQTMAELLQNSLEVSRLTQDPSTYRGRRTSINLLQRALRRAGYLTMDELEATNLSVAHFIQALQEEIQANEEEKAYSTLSQVLSQICRILEEIGASLTTTTMLRNSKQRIIESVDPVRHQQETISQTQMMDVLLILQGLEDDDSSTTERVYQDINAKQQRASLAMAAFADHFLGIPQQLTELEKQLEDMTPWMSGVFTYGQPSFADDPLEPLYLDDDGNLSSLDNVVPAPRLELGTP